jgi:hypothetical protein
MALYCLALWSRLKPHQAVMTLVARRTSGSRSAANLIVTLSVTMAVSEQRQPLQKLLFRAATVVLLIARCCATEFMEGDFVPAARRAQFNGVSLPASQTQ